MANRFWINTAGGTWDNSTTSNWSTTTGGAGGASVPGSADTAIFDANSGANIITTNYNVSITALQLTSGPFTGKLQLGGTLTLAASSSGALTLQGGTFNDEGYAVSCWDVVATGTATRVITRSGTWTITGNNTTVWSLASTGLTLNDTGTMLITDTGSNQKTLQLAGFQHNNITISGGGAGAINISTTGTPVLINGTFTSNAPTTINWQNARQFNFTNAPVFNSSSGNVITIASESAGVQTTLLYNGAGILRYNYMSLQDINVKNAAIWYVGANSTNVSNNSYPIFSNGPASGSSAGLLALL